MRFIIIVINTELERTIPFPIPRQYRSRQT